VAGVGIAVAQIASVIHMATAYGWANAPAMAVALAGVTVIMSATLLTLSIISPPGWARNGLFAGTALLLAAEWIGNFGVGGMLVQSKMPVGMAGFFGISEGAARHAAAFLFAGLIPLLVLVTIFALAKTAESLLNESMQSPRDSEWLREVQASLDHSEIPGKQAA
jgi:hypothetical protein